MASTRFGPEIVYGFNDVNNSIHSLDMSQAMPFPNAVGTLPTRIYSLAYNGTTVAALALPTAGGCCDVYKIEGGTPTALANCPNGAGYMAIAMDATNIYVADNSVFRVSLDGGTGCAPIVVNSNIPNATTQLAVGIVVDANAVYFATQNNVYKVHK